MTARRDLRQEIYHGFAILTGAPNRFLIFERERIEKGWTLSKFRVFVGSKMAAYDWIDLDLDRL